MSNPLTISYAGSLAAFDHKDISGSSAIWNYFWTYRHDLVDKSTRSGYYIFQAIKILIQDHGITKDDLKVNLWGLIEEKNKDIINSLGIQEIVKISGYVDKAESMKRLKESDLLFLPLESSKNGNKPLFIPGKLYDYMKLRKPILALAEESDCLDILNSSGLGLVLSPRDSEKIALELKSIIFNRDILAKYKPNLDYISKFSFEEKTKSLSEVFNKLLGNEPR